MALHLLLLFSKDFPQQNIQSQSHCQVIQTRSLVWLVLWFSGECSCLPAKPGEACTSSFIHLLNKYLSSATICVMCVYTGKKQWTKQIIVVFPSWSQWPTEWFILQCCSREENTLSYTCHWRAYTILFNLFQMPLMKKLVCVPIKGVGGRGNISHIQIQQMNWGDDAKNMIERCTFII